MTRNGGRTRTSQDVVPTSTPEETCTRKIRPSLNLIWWVCVLMGEERSGTLLAAGLWLLSQTLREVLQEPCNEASQVPSVRIFFSPALSLVFQRQACITMHKHMMTRSTSGHQDNDKCTKIAALLDWARQMAESVHRNRAVVRTDVTMASNRGQKLEWDLKVEEVWSWIFLQDQLVSCEKKEAGAMSRV